MTPPAPTPAPAPASSVTRLAQELLHDVSHGDVVGVTVISYLSDWSFEIASAGSVLRVPGAGIVAARILASDMEHRLRTAAAYEERRA